MRKNLDPNLRPEKQHTLSKQGNLERPHIGQGRARLKRRRADPINQAINQPSNLSQEIPGKTKIETRKANCMHSTDPVHSINNADDRIVNNKPLMSDVAFHPGPILRPPIKPIKQNMAHDQSSQNAQNINPNINFHFEENSPEVLWGVNYLSMSRPLCWSSLLCSYWSFIVHILGDAEEIG